MAEVINERPAPQALILGFEGGLNAELAALFPHAEQVVDEYHLSSIHLSEWTLLIADREVLRWVDRNACEALFIIQFEHGVCDIPHVEDSVLNGLSLTGTTAETLLRKPPDSLPQAIRQVVQGELIPTLQEGTSNHRYLEVLPVEPEAPPSDPRAALSAVEPFLQTREGKLLAGRFPRFDSRADAAGRAEARGEFVALPEDAGSPVAWVRAMLEVWREEHPKRFPTSVDWTSDPDWMTAEELERHREYEDFLAERNALLRDLEAKAADHKKRLAKARARGDEGLRRLLRVRDDALEEVVTMTLRGFGFDVQGVDELMPKGGKREDLRIRDRDAPNWIALGEVHGTKGGAGRSRLDKLQATYASRFAAEEGRQADALWYVVNHRCEDHPAVRGLPLEESPQDVQVFQENGGLVIGTVPLFRLAIAVERGVIEPDEARALLRQTRGILQFPTEDPEE